MRAPAAALIALLPALAAAGPLPSQEGWDAARQRATLPDGRTLTYVEVTPEGEAQDDPLLLLHGYTDNSRSWSLLIPHLGDRRIVALDLRGHGGSDAPACCYGLDSLAHDVAAFMDATGIERADVAGHSMGSMTGAVLAALHPERVDRLVLVSSAVAVPGEAGAVFWQALPLLSAPIDPDGAFMRAWSATAVPVDEGFLARKRAETAATPLHVWRGVVESLSLTDWSFLAGRIEAPTLALWGEADALFPAASQDRLRAALPEGAEWEGFPGLGHNLLWEDPAAVGARIRAFLDE